MRLTARHGAIVFATLALAILGLAGPASAAAGNGSSSATALSSTSGNVSSQTSVSPTAFADCPPGYACLWNVVNAASSTRWQGANRNNTLPSWIDQRSRSAYNNGQNCWAKFWTNQGAASGDYVAIIEGVGFPDLSQIGMANRIRSLSWVNCN